MHFPIGPLDSGGCLCVVCFWARHFTLTGSDLFIQVYKWVPENLILGVTLRWPTSHPIQVVREIFLVVSLLRNRYKARPDGLFGSCADLTYFALSLEKFRYSRSTMIKLKEEEMLKGEFSLVP